MVESTGDGHEPLQHRTPPLVARRRGVLCRRDLVGEQHIWAVPSWRRSKCDSARMAPGVERIDDAGPHSAPPASGNDGIAGDGNHACDAAKGLARHCNCSWQVGLPTAAHRRKWAAALATCHAASAIIDCHGNRSEPRVCRRRHDWACARPGARSCIAFRSTWIRPGRKGNEPT